MEEDLRPYVSKLSGDPKVDYDALLREIGDAKVVMFGGSTHGTHEFCEERDRITKRLIEEKGFSYVLCEADWPDMERVHRYVRGLGEDKSAVEALAGFQRFPEWMWRNQVMVDFVEWAFLHNKKVFAGEANRNTHPVSLYGLDLHSLNKSIDSVNCYLELVDPSAARRARQSYSCFDEFRHDPASYGLAAGHADCRTCEKQVLEVLLDVLKMAPENLRCDGNQRDYRCCEDLSFNAIQNALVVKDAEAYYRAMFRGSGVSAWNIRDRHMFDVIVALIEHCERVCGWESKVVVWAHNCHVSDARKSEVSWRWNEINVGQLVKEKFGGKAFSVGFSTYSGYLTSAPYWGGPARRMRLKPAVEGSFCHLLHEVSEPRFILDGAKNKLRDLQCLKRSIGVIYRPETERESHYFEAKVVQQFDETIYLDQTTALEPLDGKDEWASDADGPDQQPE